MTARIRAGELRQEITFKRWVETPLGPGKSKRELVSISSAPTVRAKVEAVGGSLRVERMVLTGDETHVMTLRYREDITVDLIIVYAGKVYRQVAPPVNVEEAGVALVLRVAEGANT